MKSSTKRSRFGFQTWKFQIPSQKPHFGVTKKDAGLPFHFHVLNLFKSWLNLWFDQEKMGIKIQKKIKKSKPKHIVFLCHILSIQVDKQGLDIFKPEKSCIYPNPKLCLMKSRMKRRGFGFQTWKFQEHPKSFILEWLRRIQVELTFYFHVLNLFKSWSNLGFDRFKWA
jgi:hypothetical protein